LRLASAARLANRVGELGAAETGPDLLAHVQAEVFGLLPADGGVDGSIEHIAHLGRLHGLLLHGLEHLLDLRVTQPCGPRLLRAVRQFHGSPQTRRELVHRLIRGCRALCRSGFRRSVRLGGLRVRCPTKEHRTGQHGHSNVHGQLHSLGL
jgi:hypothetical protein